MTKKEVLSVCDELLKLVPSGPAKKPSVEKRALELVDSLDSIRGLGALARQLIVNLKTKMEVHFSSSSGFDGVPAKQQRADLQADLESLRDRLEEDLTDEADHGPPRPR